MLRFTYLIDFMTGYIVSYLARSLKKRFKFVWGDGQYICIASFWRFLAFFKSFCFKQIKSETPLECQSVWMQIRIDIYSNLILVQIICAGYRETLKKPKKPEFNSLHVIAILCFNRFFFLQINQSQSLWIQIRLDILRCRV